MSRETCLVYESQTKILKMKDYFSENLEAKFPAPRRRNSKNLSEEEAGKIVEALEDFRNNIIHDCDYCK